MIEKFVTPLLAFAAFFFGLYGLFFSVSRVDWPVVAAAAALTVAGASAAFVVRKTRPKLTLALVTLPPLLLAAVLLLR